MHSLKIEIRKNIFISKIHKILLQIFRLQYKKIVFKKFKLLQIDTNFKNFVFLIVFKKLIFCVDFGASLGLHRFWKMAPLLNF
jgi:hypothetical protein